MSWEDIVNDVGQTFELKALETSEDGYEWTDYWTCSPKNSAPAIMERCCRQGHSTTWQRMALDGMEHKVVYSGEETIYQFNLFEDFSNGDLKITAVT